MTGAGTNTPKEEPPALLELVDVHVFYGNIEALKGISIVVHEGEVVTLIGSNGAGKSTTLRAISGTHPYAPARSGCATGRSKGFRPTRSCALGSPSHPRGAASSAA